VWIGCGRRRRVPPVQRRAACSATARPTPCHGRTGSPPQHELPRRPATGRNRGATNTSSDAKKNSATAGRSGSRRWHWRSAVSPGQYSIEAGLTQVRACRLIPRALLIAAGLVLGGEWARRRSKLAGFAASAARSRHYEHLTAAATMSPTDTVYAGLCAYGFSIRPSHSVQLGAVALATPRGGAACTDRALAALGPRREPS